MLLYLLAFVVSLVVVLAVTPVMRSLALKFGVMDKPSSSVKTHKEATPYLGGIAIWVAFVVTLLAVRFLTHFPTGTLRNLRGLFFGGTIIMIVGLLDDIKGFNYKLKFLGQIAATLILMLFDIRIQFIDNYLISFLLTLVWIIGVTNAFNIIDIMDGLSCGAAFFACLAFFFVALPTEQVYVNFASIILAGCCLGFLKHNWAPARIFMGDAGSLFIGFILAAVALGESYTTINNMALFTPVLILGIPIFDTLLVMAFRIQKGKSIFLGSKDHFALRMEALGYRRKNIVLIVYVISIFLGLAAFLITIVEFGMAVVVYLIVVFLAFLFAARLSFAKVK